MSYYSDASLVLIPSGYKDQKVYSAKPTDGSGDLVFSRASDATRVGPDGLIEKVRTNLILQSNTFDTTWFNVNTTETGGQAGYDGSSNAWLLTKSAASGYIGQNISKSGLHTISIYAKANNSDFIVIASGPAAKWYNLSDGTLGTTTGVIIDAQIESIASGWYKCTYTLNATLSNVRFYPANTDGSTSGTSGSIYIQNAMLEEGDIATQYLATTTAAVSVGPTANVPRLNYSNGCPSLLLEPQCTALNTYSEQLDNAAWTKANLTVNANQTASPTGYTDADKLSEQAVNGIHYAGQGISSAAGGTYTFSCFLKQGTTQYGGFRAVVNGFTNRYFVLLDLSNGTVVDTNTTASGVTWTHKVDTYANGWYRLSVTAAHTSGNIDISISTSDTDSPSYFGGLPTYLGTNKYIYAWGVNITQTSYVQSYVPTLGASVTRLADAAYKTGISSLIGQTEGTIYLEADIQKYNESGFYISISNGAVLGSAIYLFQPSSGTLQLLVRNSGNPDAIISILSANWTAGFNKIAIAYTSTTAQVFINGTSKGTTSFIAVPTCSQFTIGSRPDATGNLVGSGPYSQALLFKTRLTNAQLAELTSL